MSGAESEGGKGSVVCGSRSPDVRDSAESAYVKSIGSAVVRREACMLVFTSARKASMYSSTSARKASSAEGRTESKPAIARAALMERRSWDCANTGSCGAGSICGGIFWICWMLWWWWFPCGFLGAVLELVRRRFNERGGWES